MPPSTTGTSPNGLFERCSPSSRDPSASPDLSSPGIDAKKPIKPGVCVELSIQWKSGSGSVAASRSSCEIIVIRSTALLAQFVGMTAK